MSKFVQKFSRQIIASFLLFSLILPNVAQAQLVTTDPILTGQIVLEYIGKLLKVVVKNVVVVGAVQVSQKIAKDAAESVATWVWEGAPGKNPLTYMESPGDYIKKQSEAALSDVLDQMSEDVANANLLCVSDPTAALGVLGGIYTVLKDKANVKPFGKQTGGQFSPTPELNLGKCDAGSIALNYQSLTNELSSDELLKRFSNAATSGGSEVDQVVMAQMNALSSLIREQKNAETARLATKSYRDQTSLISGDVIQTSDAVEEDAKTNTAKFQQEQESRQLSGILASGAEAIPAIFATTFANAISKKIIDKLKRGKGTNPTVASVNLSNIFGAGSKNVSNSSAGALYSDTKTAIISEGELDLLSSFAACPDKFNGVDNCVIDEGFASAIRTADAGKALTVKEALDQDRLHANFEMVPPAKQALNESRLCAKSAYCFSNLAKLRKARVIPIGWEIAAAQADGTGKTTLGDVVAGFNTCTYTCSNQADKVCKTDSDCGTGSCSVPTRTKDTPFCHLIDPNWVLKMPEQICRAKVYGPQLQSDLGGDRQEVCSDQASCLAENSAGQCTGAYGYCLREKNTFRFEADECPAQFAGCRTYGNKAIGDISLVDSTIDSGSCTDKNTGCMGYYADYAPTGLFDENSPKVYLNDKAASCTLDNVGCTEVQNAVSGKQQFLRLPPAGMGCKGYSNDPTACKQYAAACTVDEVGCEVYQPVGSTDPSIPGVITAATKDTSGNVVAWNDECSAECVGYASYYQAPTPIEPVPAVATAFIPKSATMCTQDVIGCDAYQNVDTAAKGAGATAYFAQPQKCSDPEVDGNNHATYYTWEGSDQAGYQLHQHELVMETTGGAPLLDVPATQRKAIEDECTAAKYIARIGADGKPNPLFNTDCRELFDKNGKAFYRLISKTLPSSLDCVAFRKDKSDEANCIASNGKFDKVAGSCEYGFLPSASTQCKVTEVGCRAYAGAAALSPKTVLNDTFGTVDGWAGAEASNEGITVGDTVLKFIGANTSHAVSLVQDKTYNVVFWAKGQGTINVSFTGGAALKLNSEPITMSLEWRRYEVSSAPLAWTDENAKIVFEKTSGSAIYLENVVVKEQLDVVYAVKNSWTTPLSCDPIPADNIPGPALNCRVYKPKSQTNAPQVYLTGFTGLCREKSAGCQKFVSTQNTTQITEKEVSFGTATRKIPADDFVYVIADSKASCPADKKGCSALGVKIDGKIETVAKINNPEDYENSSCQVKDEWCQTFTMPGGTQRYFKYPETSKQCEYREGVEVKGTKYTGWFKKGTKEPEPCYENFVTGGNEYGIYKNQDENFTGMSGLCQPEFNQCTEFVDHADVSRENPVGHPYYFMNNNRLDTSSCGGKVSLKDGCVLLENTDAIADTTYSTLATYCKSDATNDSQCAGILKESAVAVADQGKDGVSVAPIIGINKDKISMCKTLQTNGTFVATDCDAQRAKLKSSKIEVTGTCEQVKAEVEKQRILCATIPDSNTVVKVRRDRTCSEWLACQSSVSVYDKTTQKFKDVCTDLGVCNKLSNDSGAVGQCANWVTPQQYSDEERLQRSLPLTTARYVSRNVGWYGNEFSGYSLWKKFQPDTVGRFSESPSGAGDMKIGVGFEATGSNNCTATTAIGSSCIANVFSSTAVQKMITAEFGDVSFNGQCFEQKCWYPIDGFKLNANKDSIAFTGSICRGYPEKDSPFPQSVVTESNMFGEVKEKQIGFENANVCEKNRFERLGRSKDVWTTFDEYKGIKGFPASGVYVLNNDSCECSYKKVEYGLTNETRYYSINDSVGLENKNIGRPVIVQKENDAVAWYAGTVTEQSGDIYTITLNDKEGSVVVIDSTKSKIIFSDEKAPVKKGDEVLVNRYLYGDGADHSYHWYKGVVTAGTEKVVVKFDANVPVLKDTSGKIVNPGFDASKYVISFTKAAETLKKETPRGICGGGWFVIGSKMSANPEVVSKKGLTCSTDFDCIDERIMAIKNPDVVKGGSTGGESGMTYQYSNDDGKCDFKKKETTVYGWKGYCLENDLSTHINNTMDERPCLTWLPIDVAGVDIYNQYKSAGYTPTPDGAGQFYCIESKGKAHAGSDGKTSYVYDAGSLTYSASGLTEDFSGDDIDKKVVDSWWKYTVNGLAGKNFGTDSSNYNIHNKWIAFKDYGKANLDQSVKNDIHSSEIDYVEITASSNNEFFPAGYTMKIANDGKVRVYYNEGVLAEKNNDTKDNDSEMGEPSKCPAFAASTLNNQTNNKAVFYNFLDPNAATKDVAKQGDILSVLSQQVRCASATGGSSDGESCDYYKGSGDVSSYFQCSSGETKVDNSALAEKKAIAITGVARVGKIGGQDYVPQITSGGLDQVWFVRVDNQNNKSYPLYGHKFLTYDMIRGTNNVYPGIGCPVMDQNGNNDDYKISEQAWVYGHHKGYELRLVFGKSGGKEPGGIFLGMDAASCSGKGMYDLNANWNVKFHMRNSCLKVVDVSGADGIVGAFTHRLWDGYPAGGKKAYESSNFSDAGFKVGNGVIPASQRFGSMIIEGTTPSKLLFTYLTMTENTSDGFTNSFSTGAASYSCASGSCLTDASGKPVLVTPGVGGATALHELFAKFDSVRKIDSVKYLSVYTLGTEADLAGAKMDITDTGAKTPPVIFALDSSTCGGARGGTCTMTKKYGMTINGEYADNGTVFGKGSVAATMQFYGYADQNQMPLRQISVAWGDGSELKKKGEYRNHKPVCSTQQAPVAVCKDGGGKLDYNHVCTKDKDCVGLGANSSCAIGAADLKWSFGSWGGNGSSDEGACEPNYFQFVHAYTFTPDCGDKTNNNKAKIATADEIAKYKLEGKIGVGERFCVFKPRVQLLDNWGACNGDGGKGFSGTDSFGDCYDVSNATSYQGNIIVKE
jgi:hypothetical protein